MSRYTHINLKDDVEDQAPKFGMSPNLEMRMARVPLELENSGLSYLRIGPNFRMPFGHTHKQQEEVYVLVEGSARIRIDDETRDLKQWDAVRLSKDAMRAVEGGPEGALFLAIGAPNTGPGDADMEQNWWSD
jgi:hypothetical protein